MPVYGGSSSSGASNAVPAIGGASFPPGLAFKGPVEAWSVNEVVAYAKSLELPHLEDIIRKEGVDGAVLLMDSAAQDLREAGLTFLQVKKLLARLPTSAQ